MTGLKGISTHANYENLEKYCKTNKINIASLKKDCHNKILGKLGAFKILILETNCGLFEIIYALFKGATVRGCLEAIIENEQLRNFYKMECMNYLEKNLKYTEKYDNDQEKWVPADGLLTHDGEFINSVKKQIEFIYNTDYSDCRERFMNVVNELKNDFKLENELILNERKIEQEKVKRLSFEERVKRL